MFGRVEGQYTTNTPAQTELLLHCLEKTTRSIGLYINANEIEFMCFKKEEAIPTLSSKPLNLVDLSSNISSTIGLHHLGFNEKLGENAR